MGEDTHSDPRSSPAAAPWRLVGRFAASIDTGSGPPVASWAYTQLFARFTGAQRVKPSFAQIDGDGSFALSLDGLDPIEFDPRDPPLVPVSRQDETHGLRGWEVDEPVYGSATLTSIELGAQGRWLDPPVAASRKADARRQNGEYARLLAVVWEKWLLKRTTLW